MVRHTCSITAHVYGLQDCVRSAPVLIQEVGTTHVRVYPPGDSSSPDLVKVVTAVEGTTVFVYFTQEIGPLAILHRKRQRLPILVNAERQYSPVSRVSRL